MFKVGDTVRVLQGRNAGDVGKIQRFSENNNAWVDFNRMITIRDDPFDAGTSRREVDAYWVPVNQLLGAYRPGDKHD